MVEVLSFIYLYVCMCVCLVGFVLFMYGLDRVHGRGRVGRTSRGVKSLVEEAEGEGWMAGREGCVGTHDDARRTGLHP